MQQNCCDFLTPYFSSAFPSLKDLCIDSVVKHRMRLTTYHVQHLSENALHKLMQRFLEENCLTDTIALLFFTRHRAYLSITRAAALRKRIFFEIPRLCSGLKELRLEWCKQVGNQLVISIFQCCRFLQVLYLTGCQRISDAAFLTHPFDTSCGMVRLVELGLSHCPQITTETLYVLVKKCPNLQILEIARNNHITNTSIGDILRSCRLLKCLNVEYCSKLTLQGICHSVQLRLNDGDHSNQLSSQDYLFFFYRQNNDHSLQELYLGGLRVDPPVALHNLIMVQNLRILDLRWCRGVKDSLLKSFYRNFLGTSNLFLSLKKICLRGCAEISKDALKLFNNCPNLVHIDVSWCVKLDPSDIFYVLRNHKSIEYLNISFCCPIQNLCSPSASSVTKSHLPKRRHSDDCLDLLKKARHSYLSLNEEFNCTQDKNVTLLRNSALEPNYLIKKRHQEFEDVVLSTRSGETEILLDHKAPKLDQLNPFMLEWWKFYLKNSKCPKSKSLSIRPNQYDHIYSTPPTQKYSAVWDSCTSNPPRRQLIESFILFLKNSSQTLKKYKCDGIPYIIFPDSLKQLTQCKSLKSLSIKLPHCRLKDEHKSTQIMSLLNLLESEIPAPELQVSDFKRIGKNLPLKKLRIDFSLWIVLKLTSHMPPWPPPLQRHFQDYMSLDNLLQSIFAIHTGVYRTKLHTLQLFNCHSIHKSLENAAQLNTSLNSSLLFHCLRNLRSFLISDCVDIFDDDVLMLGQAFPSAKKVFFINCPHLTEKSFFNILNSCREIETLHIVGKNFQKRLVR